MLKSSKARMADVHGGAARRCAFWLGTSRKTAFLIDPTHSEGWRSPPPAEHRTSCSTAEEDSAAPTVMHGSALAAIDAFHSCDAIGKAPPRSGLSW
jgi:hypothetical protein